MRKVRILLADDHTVMREGLRAALIRLQRASELPDQRLTTRRHPLYPSDTESSDK